MNSQLRIGVDVGGTFTDVVVSRGRSTVHGKADTTAFDLRVGVVNAIEEAAQQFDMTGSELLSSASSMVYSTTVGTNALIEHKGPVLGLITTRQCRIDHFEELHELLAPIFRSRSVNEWRERFVQFDVPHAQVNGIRDVFLEPQAKHLGLELHLQHPAKGKVVTAAPPVRFSKTPWGPLNAPPMLGEHTADVLSEPGMLPEKYCSSEIEGK